MFLSTAISTDLCGGGVVVALVAMEIGHVPSGSLKRLWLQRYMQL